MATTSFTGDARPYGGGDPYADYRSADLPFTGLVDLADRRLGAAVVAANDEFFAERENLLTPGPAVFDPERFGHKGKIMDGWETRRRRGASAARPHPTGEDHDWALVRLGVPGVVRGIVVDTAHFRGNYPRAVSIEATSLPGSPSPEELLADGVPWTTLVPRTVVGGHAANGFSVGAAAGVGSDGAGRRFTHLRVNQHPDGGIARLRVYGETAPDPGWLAALGTFDLVALENGGRVEDASDRFYSPATNTIRPGRSRQMDDGWETRRRRDTGHDWIRYALAERSEIRAVEIDTAYLKGNAAGWAALSVRDAGPGTDPHAGPGTDADSEHGTAADTGPGTGTGAGADADAGPGGATGAGPGGDWTEILARTRLQPDSVHRFVLDRPVTARQVRIDIFPDGGISRLRLFGSLTDDGAARLAERHRELGG
ncbi:allantoicase [Streptomyces sp. NBC_01498]|uniref:allantoicase n=1 Tax=Streptomyces sp. NBC_01498 TaxID=2975870 RepID=UPI002E7B8818|nr:allantoicase [Streptomyces sp. NBC_01498]WTL23835.1 allantoicase [Streptomyces sp. NBC_01498]